MKGYIPIEMPTKRYIRAFIIAQLGSKPVMSSDHVIGNKFTDVLQRHCNERRTEFARKHYDASLRVYVSINVFRRLGANLNETNVKNFNCFVQALIKDKVRFLLDVYVPLLGSFHAALGKVRETMGIEDDDWESDSIQKDYYRYRIKNKVPLLYKKRTGRRLLKMSF